MNYPPAGHGVPGGKAPGQTPPKEASGQNTVGESSMTRTCTKGSDSLHAEPTVHSSVPPGRGGSMGRLAIIAEEGMRLCFDEMDVRHACRITRCGVHVEECLDLMRERGVECALCYAVLKALKKPYARRKVPRPCPVRGTRLSRSREGEGGRTHARHFLEVV